MARPAQGWKLRKPTGSTCYSIRYWDATRKRQVELGTGESDTGRAAARASQIYAEAIRGEFKKSRRRSCVAAPLSTTEMARRWLAQVSSLLDPGTVASYALYIETHLTPVFPSLFDVSAASVKKYIADRLNKVKAGTVRKELAALRGVLRWAVDAGELSDMPMVPGVPKRFLGQPYRVEKAGEWVTVRRRSKPEELSPKEIQKLLAALPVSTPKLGPVRARFVIGYEMGLRPSVLDRLSVPEHWHPGSQWLTLPAEIMKAKKSVRKRLTRLALLALESCAPEEGYVFGHRRYEKVIREAAAKALPEEKAKTFTGAHLRSAAITHFLERGATLTAAKDFADHNLATTTDRYIRGSEKSVEQELRRQRRL